MVRLATRAVVCYHCRRGFDAAERAMILTCPHCYKPVRVSDIVVKKAHHAPRIETCGRLFVDRKGWVSAGIVHAGEGIEVLGTLDARCVVSGPVHMGARATWRGDLRAPSVHLEPGARVDAGFFEIGDEEPAPGDHE